jgi:hypothetical protein
VKQRGWFGWVLIIGLVLGLGCSGDKKGSQSSTAFPDSLVAEDLLATVNDYPIRGQDLRIFANLNGDGGDRNQTAAQYNENLLEQYIRRILLWKEAVAFGVAADDSTANSLYLRLAQSVGGERALADQLSRVKIKPEEVIQSIKRDLVIKSFVMDHFSSQISVDETEAEEFYRIASPRFRTPDRIKARHILLRHRGNPVGEKSEAPKDPGRG